MSEGRLFPKHCSLCCDRLHEDELCRWCGGTFPAPAAWHHTLSECTDRQVEHLEAEMRAHQGHALDDEFDIEDDEEEAA